MGVCHGLQRVHFRRESGSRTPLGRIRNEKVRGSNPLSSTTRPRSLTWAFVMPGVESQRRDERMLERSLSRSDQ